MDPTVVRLIEESDSMVHGWLTYSSWPVGRIPIDGQSLTKSEEQRIESSIRDRLLNDLRVTEAYVRGS